MICNASEALLAMNPLYISGAIDSWIRRSSGTGLMRMDPSGRPVPWAAEKIIPCRRDDDRRRAASGQTWHDGKPFDRRGRGVLVMAPATGDKSPMYKPFVAKHQGRLGGRRAHGALHAQDAKRRLRASTLARST